MPLIQGYLGPVDDAGKSRRLTFQFNPDKVTRRRSPVYSENLAAMADYWGNYGSNWPSPLQWIRNPPEVISFELVLDAGTARGANVEREIKLLEQMQAKSDKSAQGRTPEPPDLIFGYGARYDRVRITSYEVVEERHTEDLKVQRAVVKLDLKTQRVRVAG